ncbi:MAG: carbohydrate-binding domain-containing protein [Tenericutes bacterium]|nr:carbohydrate-binding domain-containing protein [Mycoplasmatota bacterium]
MITVDTNDYVKLVLNNVSITNSSGPAIYVKKAKTVLIYLSDNSNNYLEDSSNYSNYDEDINATIYSKDDLVLDGTGSLTVKANYQDGIVSKDDLKIINGNYTISSADDGIHADTEIIIDNGNIDIKESYEGIEAAKITINNSDIKIVASDDGINVAGGSDQSSMNRPGVNNYTNNTTNILTINDGNIYVNASGDGIDINGNGYIYGGTIIVDGPTSNGDNALDYDGELVVNGGSLIAAGSSGMVQGISSNSTQYNATIIFSNSYTGKKITITDENENTILEYTPTKTYQAVTVSSGKLKKGTTYTIKIDNETYTSFTVSSISTTVGTSNRMNNGGNMPGNGENPNNGNEPAGKPNGNQPERK